MGGATQMTSHNEVAAAWATGQKAKGSRVYSEGNTIYSYGSWFPIAHYTKGTILFNTDKYSSSTSKHQHIVRRYCAEEKIIECTTEEIRNAIDNPDQPIVIMKQKEYRTVQDCLERIRQIYHEKGIKRFPLNKIKNQIESWEIIRKL